MNRWTTTRQTTDGSVKEVTNSSVREGGSKRDLKNRIQRIVKLGTLYIQDQIKHMLLTCKIICL